MCLPITEREIVKTKTCPSCGYMLMPFEEAMKKLNGDNCPRCESSIYLFVESK